MSSLSMNVRLASSAAFGLLVVLVVMLSCSDPFVPGSVLTTFRPLAIRAEPPLARPNDSVTLDALVFDPMQRPITMFWVACDPAVAETSQSPCDDGKILEQLESGALDATTTLPEGMRSLGTSTTAIYHADAAITGEHTAVILLVAAAGAERALSRKELLISETAAVNTNPVIEFVLLGSFRIGEDDQFGVRFGRKAEWSTIVTSTSAELYTAHRPDGTEEQRVEDIRLAWYTTQGRYGTEYMPPSAKPIVDIFVDAGPKPRDAGPREGGGESSIDEFGRKVTLNLPEQNEATSDRVRVFVVVRDGRGGTTWAERSVRLVP